MERWLWGGVCDAPYPIGYLESLDNNMCESHEFIDTRKESELEKLQEKYLDALGDLEAEYV
jgi:hypothetical protein